MNEKDDSIRERRVSEPTPTDLIHELHEALYGEPGYARPVPPKVVWKGLLAEVRRVVRERNEAHVTIRAAVAGGHREQPGPHPACPECGMGGGVGADTPNPIPF